MFLRYHFFKWGLLWRHHYFIFGATATLHGGLLLHYYYVQWGLLLRHHYFNLGLTVTLSGFWMVDRITSLLWFIPGLLWRPKLIQNAKIGCWCSYIVHPWFLEDSMWISPKNTTRLAQNCCGKVFLFCPFWLVEEVKKMALWEQF